jgi:hypothetical protein
MFLAMVYSPSKAAGLRNGAYDRHETLLQVGFANRHPARVA